MEEVDIDIEIILQAAREKHPGVRPTIVSDNEPQFIAKDFKHFIRLCGMEHVRTSPNYPWPRLCPQPNLCCRINGTAAVCGASRRSGSPT